MGEDPFRMHPRAVAVDLGGVNAPHEHPLGGARRQEVHDRVQDCACEAAVEIEDAEQHDKLPKRVDL